MNSGDRAKKLIENIYSVAAEKLYEPLVVKGAFRVFGGNLNDLVLEQGRRAVDAAAGGPILDMPVGTGYFTIEMAAAHPGIVVGSDIAHGMVVQAKQLADERLAGNLTPVRSDAHHLPFRTGSFEVVVSSNGLQVIPGPELAIAEMVRVLKPEGRIFVSILSLPIVTVIPNRWWRGLPVFLSSGTRVSEMMERSGVYVTHFARERLATLIEGVKR